MKKSIVILSLLFIYFGGFGQKDSTTTPKIIKRNARYLELLGNGGLYTLNYERNIHYKDNHRTNVRFGIAYLWWEAMRTPVIVIEPIYLKEAKNHFLELSIGLTAWYGESNIYPDANGTKKIVTFLMPRVGYRYQSLRNNWFLRAGIVPFYFTEGKIRSDRGLGISYLPTPAFAFGKYF